MTLNSVLAHSEAGEPTSRRMPTLLLRNRVSEEGAAAARGAASKRSAVSASEAECFSLCLGAGPLCSAPPGGVGGGAASPADPCTPTHDDNSCDLLSALLRSSKSSLSSSAETLVSTGQAAAANSAIYNAEREEKIGEILRLKDRQPVKIDFKIFLTENTASRWEAVVQGSTLYLRLPGVLSSGSKESFMVLLDFAEERLGCTSCILCVRKSRADRTQLLRTFMFMGFAPLPPGAPLLPRDASADYVYLHCNMQ